MLDRRTIQAMPTRQLLQTHASFVDTVVRADAEIAGIRAEIEDREHQIAEVEARTEALRGLVEMTHDQLIANGYTDSDLEASVAIVNRAIDDAIGGRGETDEHEGRDGGHHAHVTHAQVSHGQVNHGQVNHGQVNHAQVPDAHERPRVAHQEVRQAQVQRPQPSQEREAGRSGEATRPREASMTREPSHPREAARQDRGAPTTERSRRDAGDQRPVRDVRARAEIGYEEERDGDFVHQPATGGDAARGDHGMASVGASIFTDIEQQGVDHGDARQPHFLRGQRPPRSMTDDSRDEGAAMTSGGFTVEPGAFRN